jgi:hypothetical protein
VAWFDSASVQVPRKRTGRVLGGLVVVLSAAPARAQPAPSAEPAADPAPPPPALPAITIGGYLQPQFRLREDSPYVSSTDGFRFARARLTLASAAALGELAFAAHVEAELQPQFSLQDAYAGVTGAALGATIALDAGQMRVPISRQNQLSDSRLSFVDKAQLATIAPPRDLGARLTVDVPGAPVRLIGGAWNGEGQNQVQNINQSYLWAARVEVTPIGAAGPLQESAFGPAFVTVAGSYGHNRLSSTAGDETVTYLGGDVAGAYRGLSGSIEYLRVQHRFGTAAQPSYDAQGVMGQLAVLAPLALPPAGRGLAELAVRVEEIDRNDAVPITVPGDPNQSVRTYTVALSYYLRQHALKLQLAANHFTELEDRTATGLSATFPNDQLLLQLTYRLE